MLKTAIIAPLFLVCCLGGVPRLRRPYLDGRIVGGRDANISEVPYQLSLEYGGNHICGASVVRHLWVVTAAHCADGVPPSEIRFRAGSSIRGSGGSLHPAGKVFIHPQYIYYKKDFDVAVIKVSIMFSSSNTIKPIPLATSEPSAGATATVTGWGTTSSGGSVPFTLQLSSIPIFDHNACNVAYAHFGGITKNMICAGVEEGGRDSCQGDSGGPLVTGRSLAGIVSWGVGCGSPGYPGVYTNVAALRSFIVSTING